MKRQQSDDYRDGAGEAVAGDGAEPAADAVPLASALPDSNSARGGRWQSGDSQAESAAQQ